MKKDNRGQKNINGDNSREIMISMGQGDPL